jgi:hypothetical protein
MAVQEPEASRRLMELQRGWWTALATADTNYLRTHSDPAMMVTLSSGKTFGVDSLVRTYGVSRHNIKIEWANEHLRPAGPATVVGTAESTETDGARPSVYRFVTVLSEIEGTWKVVAAQSTRLNTFTPRWKDAGALAGFAGEYRTPRGATLRLTAGPNFLTLREPSGIELRIEPIGMNLFESDRVSPDGTITRFSFGRDESGRVVSLSVLAPGVLNTFPKLP